MSMIAQAKIHTNRSKKQLSYIRSYSNESNVGILKAEIVGKDKNGNERPANFVTKQPTFAVRRNSSNHLNMAHCVKDATHYTKEYMELTRYLSESFNSVRKELDRNENASYGEGPVYYREKERNPQLDSFEPFNMDRWIESRFMEKTPPCS